MRKLSDWQIETILRNNSTVLDAHNIVVLEEKFSNVAKELNEKMDEQTKKGERC